MANFPLNVFASDDGHFNNKGARFLNGKVEKIISPTIISRSKSGYSAIGNAESSSASYDTETRIGDLTKKSTLTVLDEVIPGQENNLYDSNNGSFQTSPAARVMVNHTLQKLGATQSDRIILVTSSPIKRYYLNGLVNEEYIREREANFLVPVYGEGKDEPLHQFVKHIEIPESLGAFYNDCIDVKHKGGKVHINMNQDVLKQSTLYIDMGGRTIDTGVIENANVLIDDCETFEDSGMLAIHDKIQTALKSYRTNITRAELELIISSGKFVAEKTTGKQIDVRDIVNQAVSSVIESAIDRILSTYNFNNFNRIKFTGGTSIKLAPYLERYVKNAEVSKNGLYDNVYGMLKYGEFLRVSQFEKEFNVA